MAAATKAVPDPRAALLDAAERILIEEGYPAATTRTIASTAGLNHGLVHYYYGSVDNLLLATLKRFTDLLHERQRALYSSDVPFIHKWRAAMGHLVADDTDYAKLWLELRALSWNKAEFRAALQEVEVGWRQILRDAYDEAAAEYGLPVDEAQREGIITLVMTFNQGMQLQAAGGIRAGHNELLVMIDRFLTGLGGGTQ